MKIRVTWFKSSGKYYTSGEVEIKDGTYLWSPDFEQQLVNNQEIMQDGWQNSDYYYVLTQDTPESEKHGGFFFNLFPRGSFKGILKTKKN